MSSPRLNNAIVVGAILIYIAGILLGIDGNFASIDIEAILQCRVSTFNHILLLWLKPRRGPRFPNMFQEIWRPNTGDN